MKKQDNESLIQELTKRLDWYIMKASDEEFDAEEAAEADEDDIELLDDYEYVD